MKQSENQASVQERFKEANALIEDGQIEKGLKILTDLVNEGHPEARARIAEVNDESWISKSEWPSEFE